ncbi:MAG: peptidoglycan-binding protein [Pseudanabaenaceae cyanobacterium]
MLGDYGAEVKQLQQLLKWWGIPVKIDGYFGRETLEAVTKFQLRRTNGVAYASKNLTVDGIVGSETWAELTKTPIRKLDNEAKSSHPQISAFLKMIRVPEGTASPDGYRTMFTGKLFNDFSDHPRELQCSNGLCSDAAGAYQFLSTTWDDVAKDLKLPDFSPQSQDLGAIELIRRRGAYENIIDGRIVLALEKTSWEWASLPPGRYGQPSISFKRATELFVEYGGIVRG